MELFVPSHISSVSGFVKARKSGLGFALFSLWGAAPDPALPWAFTGEHYSPSGLDAQILKNSTRQNAGFPELRAF